MLAVFRALLNGSKSTYKIKTNSFQTIKNKCFRIVKINLCLFYNFGFKRFFKYCSWWKAFEQLLFVFERNEFNFHIFFHKCNRINICDIYSHFQKNECSGNFFIPSCRVILESISLFSDIHWWKIKKWKIQINFSKLKSI